MNNTYRHPSLGGGWGEDYIKGGSIININFPNPRFNLTITSYIYS